MSHQAFHHVISMAPSAKPGTFKKTRAPPVQETNPTTTVIPAVEAGSLPQIRPNAARRVQIDTNMGEAPEMPAPQQSLWATAHFLLRPVKLPYYWHDPMQGVRWELTIVFYQAAQKPATWKLDTEQIRKDLGEERPNWILSSYGAAKQTPASLFKENEYSPEEIRLRFYEMAQKGQEAQADQEAAQLWSKADVDIKSALGRVNDVQRFMDEAEKNHPNRYDYLKTDGKQTGEEIAKMAAASQNGGQSSGFNVSSNLGQSSAPTNPFSKPPTSAFGQPTTPSAFGKPAFGQSTATFGQPSGPSPFGQPAVGAGFGKPAFGATGLGQQSQSTPAFGSSPFGQPTQPTPAFGQSSSPFGQASQPTTAFGQPIQPGFGQTSFGQPAQPTSGFGQSGFGQATKPANGSPFGQASTSSPFGQNTSSSPFGAGVVNTGGFGQAPQQNASPFGIQQPPVPPPEVSMDAEQPSGFSQQSVSTTINNNNPFGVAPSNQSILPGIRPSPFGSTSNSVSNNTSHQTSHPLTGQAPAMIHFTQRLPSAPIATDMTGKLSRFRGQQVQYFDDGTAPYYSRTDSQGAEKIWFPEGEVNQEVGVLKRDEKLDDLQVSREAYSGEAVEEYKHLVSTGTFEPGKVPDVPPMRDWVSYDF